MAKQPIGDFLCALRKAHGYTQQEVADKLGVSNRTVSAWEQGRAYPDLLTLPAIAEIYGVTADEILNGERKTHKDGEAELSEKTLSKLYKSKLASFSSKTVALAGVGSGGAAVLLLAAAIGGFAPAWLVVLFCVLAAVDAITVLTLLVIFDGGARASAGIYRGDGLDDKKTGFIKDLRRYETRFLLILGGVWTLCGLAALLILSLVYGIASLTALGYALFCIALIIGIGILVAAIVLYNREITLRGSERDKAVRIKRFKLLGKCAAYLAIPLGICLILSVVFTFVFIPQSSEETYFPAERKEFYEHFNTVAVTSQFTDAGRYYVDFGELLKSEPNGDGSYNLNEKGTLKLALDDERGTCTVTGLATDGSYGEVVTAERMFVTGSDERIYDFRRLNYPTKNVYVLWLKVDGYLNGKTVEVKDGIYSVRFHYLMDLSSVVVPLSWLTTAIAVIADLAVYAALAVKIKE